MPADNIINIRGIELLSERQKQLVNRLLNEYYKRIFRMIKNLTVFEVTIKEYEKEGKQQKFSFNVKVVSPAGVFKADGFDWDFERSLHKALNKVMNEIEHKLHSSEQHDKMRRSQLNRERK